MADSLKLQQTSLAQLHKAAETILDFGHKAQSKIYAFYGQMGAGKTTLIKELCLQLGSTDNFSSPTYSLINEYAIAGKPEKIYHMDLFRLKSTAEALYLGLSDYLNSDDYCFIEWPELAENILPYNTIKVVISGENNTREMIIFMG